jgi:hypothetical protein
MAAQDYFLFKANEFFEKAKGEANREKRMAFESVARGYLRMAEDGTRKKEPAADL